MAKASVVDGNGKKITKRQQVLECITRNPAATNEEIAKSLGKEFTAQSVAAIKSQEKAKIKRQTAEDTSAPLDLNALKNNAPKIQELGGPETVLELVSSYRRLVESFGSLDRAEALCQSLIEIRSVIGSIPEAK